MEIVEKVKAMQFILQFTAQMPPKTIIRVFTAF